MCHFVLRLLGSYTKYNVEGGESFAYFIRPALSFLLVVSTEAAASLPDNNNRAGIIGGAGGHRRNSQEHRKSYALQVPLLVTFHHQSCRV